MMPCCIAPIPYESLRQDIKRVKDYTQDTLNYDSIMGAKATKTMQKVIETNAVELSSGL
jgi:hypothetical protein